jgi:hypothetical protein
MGNATGTVIIDHSGIEISKGTLRSGDLTIDTGTKLDLDNETLKFGGSQVNAAGDYAGIFLGKDSAKYKLFAGDPESYLSFDGLNTAAKFRTFEMSQEDTPTACTSALAGDGAGNVDNGTHTYKIIFVTSIGKTAIGSASNTVTVVDKTSNGKVNLTNIPTGTNKVTARKLYRTVADGSSHSYLGTISDGTTTTYTDNTADADLTYAGFSTFFNTTGSTIYLGSKSIFHVDLVNVSIGVDAGNLFNTSGYQNLSIGSDACKNITTGDYNTGVGHIALNEIISGSHNTCFGAAAGYNITTGSCNTLMGLSAGVDIVTGEFNVCLGDSANVSSSAQDNSVAIGKGTTVTASNKVRIGNTSITEIGGQVGWSTLSDRRCKENINPEPLGLEFIKKLEPVNFNFKPTVKLIDKQMESVGNEKQVIEMEEHPTKRLGLIAQDVKQAADDMGATFDVYYQAQNDDDHDSLVYSSFVIPLINAVKELSMEIEALKSTKNML